MTAQEKFWLKNFDHRRQKTKVRAYNQMNDLSMAVYPLNIIRA